ncbi:hypothetical protein [Flavobacterium tructae]|uniref:Uncharacterized protein n=1 Tax=Flavobacterium tructae TaxID=1114873 RepID=A0A1S1J3S7_9FLAO|nr:hypothetical protein [Flavobacterium tructae]OHT44430.1 hypothetical protein BHE19_11965 [Flavobacterium tructae]OXB19434.1 hypothetical protein B0A71_12910 [Flavobacterium tructae]
MAVDKQKVIARLKVLFPKANLSQKRLDAIADKLAKKPADDADDTAIDAVINDFNDVMSIEDIAKDDDRTRTLEAEKQKGIEEARKKAGLDPIEKKDEKVELPDNTPDYVKLIMGKLDSVSTELEAIKAGKATETKKASASEQFNKSEILKRIPESVKPNWINRIDVNSETSFEDQIKNLETEYGQLVQLSADTNQYAPPAGGGNPSDIKVDDAVVEGMLNI